MNYLIVTGGTAPTKKLFLKHLANKDILIGVDGAADMLCEYGIVADVLIGDFDTANKKSVGFQQNNGAAIVRLETHKNETDTEAALNYAIENGASQIVILGALGSRFDHTQTNIMLLVRAHGSGVDAKIIDEHNELFVCNSSVNINSRAGETLSILPLTGNVTVTALGLYYPLENLTLCFGSSRGISNVIMSDNAQISVSGAHALIVIASDSE